MISNSNTKVIAGSVVGGFIGFLFIIALIFACIRKHKRNSSNDIEPVDEPFHSHTTSDILKSSPWEAEADNSPIPVLFPSVNLTQGLPLRSDIIPRNSDQHGLNNLNNEQTAIITSMYRHAATEEQVARVIRAMGERNADVQMTAHVVAQSETTSFTVSTRTAPSHVWAMMNASYILVPCDSI